MDLIKGTQSLARVYSHPVLTIGNFDGVHLGHRRIVGIAKETASARQGACLAMTFRPHPRAALRPDLPLALLTTYDEKIELLASLGLDAVIEEPFSREFSTIEPEEFFRSVILRSVRPEAVVVGYDFSFGKDRHGDLAMLGRLCREAGVELTVVPALCEGEEVVSSSRIREHLLEGEVERANRMLGREFSYRGVVIKGEGRGRKLGFPTANLKLENKLALPFGVYATEVRLDGKILPSVTNVGVRPTFVAQTGAGELPALVETHLLDSSLDLYGRMIEVAFIRRLREERKFPSAEALQAQILADCQQARDTLRRLDKKRHSPDH